MAEAALTTLRAGRRTPRLVLRFALVSTLGLTLAAAVIVTLARHAYATQGEQRATEGARLTTQAVLQGRIRAGDLSGPVKGARRDRLDRLFRREVLVNGTLAATIYNGRARVVYSIARPTAGAGSLNPVLVREALAGKLIARVETPRSGSGRFLATYLPFEIGPGGARGVLVLEQDYAPIAAAARHSTLVVAAVLEGVLLALLLLLLPMLARASGQIRAQIGELDRLATHDELTGLANRVGFRRQLAALVARGSGAGAVMLVDIDDFHELNDTLGPDEGDRLLAAIADRLTGLERPMLAARLGEDEFALLLPDTDEPEAFLVAERIQEVLGEPLNIGHLQLAVDARIGCSLFPTHGSDPTTLTRRAGVALSIAKAGRSRVVVYDPDHDDSDVSRLTLTAELRQALRNGELCVHYQPQADFATGVIRGAEALVRWQHPVHGLLPASEFVPRAERTELIGDITRFVLETAAAQWEEWAARGLRLDVAVNLSAVDLLDVRLPGEIRALIRRHGLPAEYLVLEITEGTLLRDERRSQRSLRHLHDIGVRLAIDDYGTGYSSLAYLHNLPARQLKLDRSLTADVPTDRRSEAIVRSTIELAHKLGATVVAEGIETTAQWQHIAALGCDIAQGYLIGEPQAADRLTPKPAVDTDRRSTAA